MLAAAQHGGEYVLIGPEIVEEPLANFRAKVLNLIIDMVERKVDGELPHLLDKCRGPVE